MTLPVTMVSASALMAMALLLGLEPPPVIWRTTLLAQTASRPPSLKLVMAIPVAAVSMMLPEITAPSKANST